MKTIAAIVLLIASTSSRKLSTEGIPDKDLMDQQPRFSHKPWPQGVVDASQDDAEVIAEYNIPAPKKAPVPPKIYSDWITYEPHSTTM